jgi:hypothetical protein
MDGRTARLALIAIVTGIAFGIGTRLANPTSLVWVGRAGATWFLVAFVMGRLSRSTGEGALAGAAGLVIANTSYYLWRFFVEQSVPVRYLGRAGLFWMVMATACGLVAGAIGHARAERPALWGVTAGVFAGEALAVATRRDRPTQVVVESLIALLCLVVALRGRVRDVVMATGLGVASVIVLGLSYKAALGR